MSDSQIKVVAAAPARAEKKDFYRVPKWAMWLLGFLLVALLVLVIVLPLTVTKKETVKEIVTVPAALVPEYDVLQGPSPFDFDYQIVKDPNATYTRADRKPEDVFKTLDWKQKLGQISQFSRGDTSGPGLGTDDSMDSWLGLIDRGGAGSFLNVNNRTDVITFQTKAADSGSKVSVLIAYDTIHGYRTGFPVNLGMAASFDRGMHRQYAEFAARETLANGIRLTFAPMMDIARDPRWGRISESSGEDPYLTGELGSEVVKGFQANGVAACVKHFAAYGAAQAGRDYHTAQLGTAYLHNDYLPAYKKALDAGALSLMASFNTVDGVPAHANRYLLTDILRGLWGWEGLVISDYGGIRELKNHRVADSNFTAGRMSLMAGVDMAMADGYFDFYGFKDADPNYPMPGGGTLLDYVNLATKRVLAVKGALGLLDAQASIPSTISMQDLWSNWVKEEYLTAAQRAAEKSMVLLKNKNNNVLPLKPTSTTKYLVLGYLADNGWDQRGSWAGETWCDSFEDMQAGCCVWGNECAKQVKTITYWQALQQRAADGNGFTVEWENGYGSPYNKCDETTTTFQNAVNKAQSGDYDAIIAVVGEGEMQNGEAASRTDLHLSGCQRPLLEAIRLNNTTPIIMVVNAGRQLVIDWEDQEMDAIIYAWASGTRGGPALANILFGDVNPSGKMPVTTPRSVGQIPIYYSQLDTGRPLDTPGDVVQDDNSWDGSYRWFRSHYIDNYNSPLYPFGYGMSYSNFTYAKPTISHRDGDSLNVTVTVTMSGNSPAPADEIVQVYVKDMFATISPPRKRLRQFERLSFNSAGAQVTHTFPLNITEDFGYYDNQLNWIVEPGKFRIIVAPSSADESNYVEVDV